MVVIKINLQKKKEAFNSMRAFFFERANMTSIRIFYNLRKLFSRETSSLLSYLWLIDQRNFFYHRKKNENLLK